MKRLLIVTMVVLLVAVLSPAEEGKSMKIKIASICPTAEKARNNDKLEFHFVAAGASADEAIEHATANLKRIGPLIDQAAANGAKMACLPEDLMCLTHWNDEASPDVRRHVLAETWKVFCRELGAAAKKNDIILVAGGYEVIGDKYYNAAALFNEAGELLGTYHKVQLAGKERKYLTPGDRFPVYQTKYGKVGMLICWDIIYPGATQSLMLNGADILFEPTWGHSGPQADFTAKARAHDSVCPIVISMWCGNGRIVANDGTFLAKCGKKRNKDKLIPDQIIYAELDPKAKRKFLGFDDFRAGLIRQRQWKAYWPLVKPTGSNDADAPAK